jgi:5-methyltetrahydrofolate--homocysteine methyltransferase
MNMEQKRERHRRFWQPLTKGEGSYLSVVSPIDDSSKKPVEPPVPRSLEERWLSPDFLVKHIEAGLHNTFHGQDAIPGAWPNIGPGCQAALLGAPYRLTEGSVWFDLEPPIKDWDTPYSFKMDREMDLFKTIEAQTRALCEASKGRYAIAYTDIGGVLDVLFSLRGEELLADLIEYPDIVLDAQNRLDDAFLEYFYFLTDILKPYGYGFTSWQPMVNDVPWYPLQCDLCVMISCAMFEKFVLPSLDRVSTDIGQSVYHLDGPEEVKHLDMLLSLKHVHAIQWTPLPRPGEYIHQDFADVMSLDIYRRSKAAGKKVVLLSVHPQQVETIINEVGADGLFMNTYFGTRKDADDFIATAHGKKWVR